MNSLTLDAIDSSSDEQLLSLLSKELQNRISVSRGSPEYLPQIRTLPIGLRAMAATYELDVSMALDDLGWHFGNWHDLDLAEETVKGLSELGAKDLASIFAEAVQLARNHWDELGQENWMKWYHGSLFEQAMAPLNQRTRAILDQKGGSLFKYWVDYARRFPEKIGVAED